jgi:hypothetical protein
MTGFNASCGAKQCWRRYAAIAHGRRTSNLNEVDISTGFAGIHRACHLAINRLPA